MAKGLKLKVKKFWGLRPMFVEVTGENLNRVKGSKKIPPNLLPNVLQIYCKCVANVLQICCNCVANVLETHSRL